MPRCRVHLIILVHRRTAGREGTHPAPPLAPQLVEDCAAGTGGAGVPEEIRAFGEARNHLTLAPHNVAVLSEICVDASLIGQPKILVTLGR
jgi:hypothetical protein